MRVEVIDAPNHPYQSPYPCLKQSKEYGFIVLFIAPGTGVVVKAAVSTKGYVLVYHKLGCYSTDWVDACFVPFHGTVQLIED